MNINKNNYFSQMKARKKRMRPATAILLCCLPPILFCLLGILWLIGTGAPLTQADAVYFGGMLEYPVAALVIVTAGAVIADIAWKRGT